MVSTPHPQSGTKNRNSEGSRVPTQLGVYIPMTDEHVHAATLANREPLMVALVALEGPVSGDDILKHPVAEKANIRSPATVYKPLHDLHDRGILDRDDLVQSKRYTIGDRQAAAEVLQGAINAHLYLIDLYARGLDVEPRKATDRDRLRALIEEVDDAA